MDASAALSDLLGLSTQVVEAVVTGPDGTVEASHTASDHRAQELSLVGVRLLSDAAAIRPGAPVARVHVDLERGSVVVVRDGERMIVATTVPEPTAGLVAFDLRAALRRAGEEPA
jgi:predicted regulator of Ras-like GTPase activity (Roadblock/LC7/MglB family)